MNRGHEYSRIILRVFIGGNRCVSTQSKIKLKKRSRQSARIHRGFAMPVGPGSENSLVSFRDFADLKAKYFRFTGRIQRRPFIFRTLILMFAQFMFSIILYSKIVESILINHMEYAIIFGIIFVLLSIPAIWSQISLGVRRCHDINKPGLMFAVPFIVIWPAMSCPSWDRIRRRRQPSRSWLYPI